MNTRTYVVSGMTCDHCAGTIATAVGAVPGVSEVTVDRPAGQVQVSSGPPVDDDAVRAAVEEAGYQVVSPCPAARG